MFSDYHLAISFLLCPSKIVSNIQQQDTQTHPFNGPLSGDYPREPVPETAAANDPDRGQAGFYWSKRQWVAVESTRPYVSLHLAPDR